jgi:hypothetical protein
MVDVSLPPPDVHDAKSLPPGTSLPWRATPTRRFASGLTAAGIVVAAGALGGFSAISPRTVLALCIAAALFASVIAKPALAGYLLIAVTPLVAGIDRGHAIPVLRPGEAVALAFGAALAARGMLRLRMGGLPKLKLTGIETALVLLAVTNSFVPMLWMIARRHPITPDDLLYALVMWKYLGVYVIVRVSITTEQQVRRCLWLSVAAACIVAVIAILQSLGLFGVPRLLASYYAPFGYTGALDHARGSSTLGLPAATSDLMIYNLAIVSGLWIGGRRHRLVLATCGALFVVGALSAGEFSSAIGLVIAVCCISIVTSYPRLLSLFVPAGALALVALRPVIERRLSGFDSVSGLPVSWTGRLENLRSYFWPKLFSDWNYLLGVRPSARVPVSFQATGYVWIESGYTWLLWGGGIPLFASFVFLVHIVTRTGWRVARASNEPSSVAALAAVVAVLVMTVLMAFDPHLTYRGAAEEFFALLALFGLRARAQRASSSSAEEVAALAREARS